MHSPIFYLDLCQTVGSSLDTVNSRTTCRKLWRTQRIMKGEASSSVVVSIKGGFTVAVNPSQFLLTAVKNLDSISIANYIY